MAEGNGEVVEEMANQKSGEGGDGERTQDYSKLLEYGLHKMVAGRLDDIYKTGKLAHSELDERALDALKEFHVEGALDVLDQFLDSNLEHVSNKSAFLCGVMKTYRQNSGNAARTTGTGSDSASEGSGRGEDQSNSGANGIHTGRHYRTTQVRRTTSQLGGQHARERLRGVLRQDTKRYVRGRADPAVREVRQDLGPPANDGPDDRHQPGLRLRYLHLTGLGLERRSGAE